MNITIKKSKDDDKRKTIWLPMEEEELEEVSNELGIEMTTEPNCYIESSRNERTTDVNLWNIKLTALTAQISRPTDGGESIAGKQTARDFPRCLLDVLPLCPNIHSISRRSPSFHVLRKCFINRRH